MTGSQHGQDDWVLSQFPSGTFLDVGCCDGVHLSNTLKLEQHGWSGIAIDAFPTNFEHRVNTKTVAAVVYSSRDMLVDFIMPGEVELAGIECHLTDWHKQSIISGDHSKLHLKTKLLHEILNEINAPKFIEYLSLDIEGAEWEVLRTFPFNEYQFGCLTVEHNYQEPERSYVQELLGTKGYKLVKTVKCDDWYANDSLEDFAGGKIDV
jgi:hypothetical protein